MENLTIVKVSVGEAPEVTAIPHTNEAMNELVGGWLETVRIAEDILLVVDEEGLLKDKEENFITIVLKGVVPIPVHTIVGNCFFISFEGEEFVSLNDEQIERVLQMFSRSRKYCVCATE